MQIALPLVEREAKQTASFFQNKDCEVPLAPNRRIISEAADESYPQHQETLMAAGYTKGRLLFQETALPCIQMTKKGIPVRNTLCPTRLTDSADQYLLR
jgi:hypothetical protein